MTCYWCSHYWRLYMLRSGQPYVVIVLNNWTVPTRREFQVWVRQTRETLEQYSHKILYWHCIISITHSGKSLSLINISLPEAKCHHSWLWSFQNNHQCRNQAQISKISNTIIISFSIQNTSTCKNLGFIEQHVTILHLSSCPSSRCPTSHFTFTPCFSD